MKLGWRHKDHKGQADRLAKCLNRFLCKMDSASRHFSTKKSTRRDPLRDCETSNLAKVRFQLYPLPSPLCVTILFLSRVKSPPAAASLFTSPPQAPPHPLPNIADLDCTLLCLRNFCQYNDFFSMVFTPPALSAVPCPETEGELRIEIIISCCGRR